jgi:hypothetical protein
MEFWQTWCMHQIEDLANFVRIGEIPQNVNIGQGLGK